MQKNKKKAYHPTVVSSTPPVQLKTSTENLSSVEEEGGEETASLESQCEMEYPKNQDNNTGLRRDARI